MKSPRDMPLFDATAQPSSWNERMVPGEYAVHYSNFEGQAVPSCTVCGSLEEAEAYALERVAERTDLRCRIYDHQGFLGKPLREISGSSYKKESEISQRFRRWVGSVMLLGGLALVALDWSHDFSLSWPAMIGARMLIPGVLLLVTELLFVLLAKRQASHR